jgi:hypothetical protein
MVYLMWTGAETLGRMHSPLPYSLLANIIRTASLVAFFRAMRRSSREGVIDVEREPGSRSKPMKTNHESHTEKT